MTTLQALANDQDTWTLDELAERANVLLPRFLPDDPANSRATADVTPRLIRHYTSEGLLDDPIKEGREARYAYRHLLQLLVVRRLLAEGLNTNAIGDVARSRDDRELEALLQGGIRIELTPANDALAYLEGIRRRSQTQTPPADRQPPGPAPSSPPAESPTEPAPPEPASPLRASTWSRYELLPGLELHVRDDVQVPETIAEQRNLLSYLMEKLLEIRQRRTT